MKLHYRRVCFLGLGLVSIGLTACQPSDPINDPSAWRTRQQSIIRYNEAKGVDYTYYATYRLMEVQKLVELAMTPVSEQATLPTENDCGAVRFDRRVANRRSLQINTNGCKLGQAKTVGLTTITARESLQGDYLSEDGVPYLISYQTDGPFEVDFSRTQSEPMGKAHLLESRQLVLNLMKGDSTSAPLSYAFTYYLDARVDQFLEDSKATAVDSGLQRLKVEGFLTVSSGKVREIGIDRLLLNTDGHRDLTFKGRYKRDRVQDHNSYSVTLQVQSGGSEAKSTEALPVLEKGSCAVLNGDLTVKTFSTSNPKDKIKNRESSTLKLSDEGLTVEATGDKLPWNLCPDGEAPAGKISVLASPNQIPYAAILLK